MAKFEFRDKEYEKFETAFIQRLVMYRRGFKPHAERNGR